MSDNPESPNSNPDVRTAQASVPSQKERSQNASERPNQFETVPEAPTLTKQILVSSPFKKYEDIFQANDKTSGKESGPTPAIFSILNSTMKGKIVQVTDGKETFWINIEEAKAQDWSVKQGFQKSEHTSAGRSELRIYMKADDEKASSAKLWVPPGTFFPVFDIGTKSSSLSWKRIGVDLQGKTSELKTMPLWTNDRNEEDQLIGKGCYFVSENDLRKFLVNLKQCVETFSLLSTSERKSSDRILDVLQLSYLSLFGARMGSPDGAQQTLEYVKKRTGVCSDSLNLTLDDIARMDDLAYKQWLNRLTAGTKTIEERLATQNKNTVEISTDGTMTKFYVIPFDYLP